MTGRLRSVTALAMLAVIAAACSPSASESPSEPPSVAPSAAASVDTTPEVSDLTVGVLPIVDVAPVYVAINEGLFEAQGLSVTPEVMQGGAAAIPALQAGDLDIAFGAWPSFLTANQEGISLAAISDGVASVPGFTEFLALPDSGLEGNPAGMAGTTIALNTLANVGELALRSTLRDAGVDYADVTPVEIPFPEMGAALGNGSVDVIWGPEPGVTANKTGDLGAVTIVDSYVGEMENWPVAGYMATTDFAEANPNTVAAFVRALELAADLINEDSQVAIDTVLTYTTLPLALVEQLTFPEYRAAIDVATLQRVYDYMLEFEMIDEGLDIEPLVLPSS